MTNNSIFTRVLALVICFIMLVGGLASCFNETDHTNNVGTTTNGGVTTKPTTPTTSTGDVAGGDDPIEDPVDPNEIFSASTELGDDALIYGTLASDVVIGGTELGALVPADVKVEAGASSLALSIKNVEEEVLSDALSTLDVHINGVAKDNTVPMLVKLGAVLEAGLGETELKLYHIENGTPVLMMRVESTSDFAIHNQYVYDAETGEVTIYVATFSVFTAVQATASKWTEETVADTSWYNENDTEFTLEDVADFLGFRDLVDGGNKFEGKTVTLATDIDLDNKLFNPIGGGWAYNGGNTFNGTFDGGNHTIYNLYVNGWDLDETGDKHSCTSMGAGLFSSIHNATIKNIAVVGSELVVETTSIGIIAGCAQGQCTFENIVVSDATLGNYQMRNGGIVGDIYVIADDNVPEGEYTHTFTNIVVDSSVKLSSMWGDFDTGNGGVIGGKYGSSKVLMKNVIVAAELDVFSDVTAAYQWYAYRRCGMLVGYTGQNSPKQATNAAADFLTCENVSVYYGEWTNYTYYQFTNQDSAWQSNYPWVRTQESDYNGPFSNVRYGNPVVGGVKINTIELAEANKTGFAAITFNQLYGGGQGVYGTNEHAGVTIHNNLASAKTIYILNNAGWENLKLQYWFRNGEDTWTTNIDGIDMATMYLSTYNVYKIDLPSYVDGFRVVADDENAVEFTLAGLTDGETYTVSGETHEHNFVDDKCECGAYKIQKGELVTDVNDLNTGDKIIIVAVNSDVALGTTQNSNNRNQVAIVKNGDGTVTINTNVQIITLEAGSINGTFAFNVGDGYLYAASSSSNHLKTQNDKTDNGSWLITIENGVATIKAQGEYTRNWLMHNATSSIFSCYSSGQQDIAIYKLSANEEIVEVHDCKEFAFGATCEDNAICSKCSNVIEDSALGHDYVGKETAPTCTDAGYTTYNCSRCDKSYKETGNEALGHTYVDGVCSVCGAIDSTAIDYSGRYYIATIRTSGNYFYMTNNLGTASTKRYQAVDSELTTLPEEIASGESDKIFVLEKNDDGTYSIYAEGVDGNNYLGWTDENSGILVAKEDALKLTVDKKEDGIYNIHFTGDSERYLALNQNTGSNYFAWYKSGQKQDLSLVPVKTCEHNYNSVVTAPTCTVDGYTTYTCTECSYTYTGDIVTATGHVNTTTTTVDATCTVAGSVTVTCDDCGDTVSTEVIEATGHNYVDGNCTGCGEAEPIEPTHECESKCAECGKCTDAECTEAACADKCEGHNVATETTVSMDIFANQGSLANKVITWTSGDVTVSNSQGSSTTAIRTTDTDHYRVYKSSTVKVEVGNDATLTKIVITCVSGYVNGISEGAENAGYTVTVDGTVVTITVSGVSYIEFTTSAQARISNIEVTYAPAISCEHTNTTETTVNATCTEAGYVTVTCDDCEKVISTEVIEATGHNYVDGVCACGATDGGSAEPEKMPTTKYSFSSYTAGTQYAQNEEHQLDENTKLIINGAHLNTQIRLYSGSNCVFEFNKTVENIKVTAGNKAGTLTVYVSNDGSTWTKVETITTTTSYTEYSVDLNGSYEYVKLESSGAQIRVSILTVNP